MKKIIITVILILNFSLKAQECGVIYSDINIPINLPTSFDIPPSYEPIVFNLFFHVIKDDFGNRPIPITETQILAAVGALNLGFNQHKIFFKYRGSRDIKKSTFMNIVRYDADGIDNSYQDLLNYNDLHHEYYDDKCYDIFITSQIENGLINASATLVGQSMVITDWNLTYQRILCHEMGHSFYLYHTDNFASSACCENVTRDINDPNYNATTKGDFIHDTPATPYNLAPGSYPNCIWNGIAYDTAVPPVQYPPIELNNFMFSKTCSNTSLFTPLQVARMRNVIETFNEFDNIKTDILSLYEPFDARVVAGNVISAEDQPENGGAFVCRSQKYRMRFQPGFFYHFYETISGPDYALTGQQFNYDNIFDHNIGVRIPIVDNDLIVQTGGINSVTDRLCGFEPYVSGTLYSMAVLGEMNMTVKELNEIEVKDPELYSKLMERYYYILKKLTASGVETSQTFYKY